MFGYRRNFDWNVRACGRHGHITYAPTDAGLAERLRVETAVGACWRCLRCGLFVPGTPQAHGPADRAPIVLRGRALRDAFVIRLLAAERFIRGVLLVALGYGIYRFDGSKSALRQVFDRYFPAASHFADRIGIDLQDTGPVHLIEKALSTSHSTLMLVTLGVVAYGALELLEGVGLWLLRRWGEYVAVVGTSVFLPLEIYELTEKFTWLRVGALAINLFLVVYLVWSKRLFGVRGGHAAFERKRRGESLLEVEATALTA